MKHFSRQRAEKGKAVLAALALGLLAVAGATACEIRPASGGALLLGSSQGYLGVELSNVDGQRAQALKLKDTRGAVITLIDHDAPAGKIGLRVNDVVLQVNGQNVEGAEQARKILRETPAGHKLTLTIGRDGAVQTLHVELADRKAVEHDAWNRIDQGSDLLPAGPAMGMLPSGKKAGRNASLTSGWHLPFFGGVNVGVDVEPLNGQMADVLGVKNGLMIKQVSRRSAASAAGLKALDVILKVGQEPITNMSGWDRAMRANQGRTVQVTILRDRKQQTVQLLVDSKRRG